MKVDLSRVYYGVVTERDLFEGEPENGVPAKPIIWEGPLSTRFDAEKRREMINTRYGKSYLCEIRIVEDPRSWEVRAADFMKRLLKSNEGSSGQGILFITPELRQKLEDLLNENSRT